jgi:hypothetical protein
MPWLAVASLHSAYLNGATLQCDWPIETLTEQFLYLAAIEQVPGAVVQILNIENLPGLFVVDGVGTRHLFAAHKIGGVIYEIRIVPVIGISEFDKTIAFLGIEKGAYDVIAVFVEEIALPVSPNLAIMPHLQNQIRERQSEIDQGFFRQLLQSLDFCQSVSEFLWNLLKIHKITLYLRNLPNSTKVDAGPPAKQKNAG